MALAGIFQILHTPFTDDGTIDWQSFANQIDYCMAAKVHGLVLPAMASEFFTLSDEERYDVVEFASTAIDGRVPLVVGVQAITLHLALKFAEHAIAHKADALMAMPPYLRKAAKPDVEAYYKALASLGVPLMIQTRRLRSARRSARLNWRPCWRPCRTCATSKRRHRRSCSASPRSSISPARTATACSAARTAFIWLMSWNAARAGTCQRADWSTCR